MGTPTPLGKEALEKGRVELLVRRQGTLQRVEFVVKRLPQGNAAYVALCSDRLVDAEELARLAAETGLPIFAANGKVFPKGKGVSDFIGL